jgi:hypothetical protein
MVRVAPCSDWRIAHAIRSSANLNSRIASSPFSRHSTQPNSAICFLSRSSSGGQHADNSFAVTPSALRLLTLPWPLSSGVGGTRSHCSANPVELICAPFACLCHAAPVESELPTVALLDRTPVCGWLFALL